MVWYSHLFQNFPQFVVVHIVKGFGVVNKSEVGIFQEDLKTTTPYMTTGKTIALTRQTFVEKVMSLLFNMLSRLVITFFPSSKRLFISWLHSPSLSPSISHEVMGPDAMMLVF